MVMKLFMYTNCIERFTDDVTKNLRMIFFINLGEPGDRFGLQTG